MPILISNTGLGGGLKVYGNTTGGFKARYLSIVTSGLVLNLDAGNPLSYPGTGTTWFDLSTSNKNGTLVNGPSFDSANGGSIVFDGTNDYVNVATFTSLSDVSQFSYSAFLNFSTAAGNYNTFFAIGFNAEYNNDILFAWEKSSNTLLFQVNNGLDGGATYAYNAPSNWMNLSVVYDGSLSTNATKLKVFINGVQLTLSFGSYNVPTKTSNRTDQLIRIGEYLNNTLFFYTGKIATTFLYNRALTQSEVLQNYNAQKLRFGL